MSLFPESFKKMPLSHKIAYISVMSAMSVIANLYSIPLFAGIAKLSFVTTVLILAGALFGPVIGFVIGFLGDLLQFLISAGEAAYSPLIGISNGVAAAIAGIIFMIFAKKSLLLKVVFSSVLAYFICTLVITSLGIYLIFGSQRTFIAFMIKRIVTQTPINIANGIICFFLMRALSKVKLFRLSFS